MYRYRSDVTGTEMTSSAFVPAHAHSTEVLLDQGDADPFVATQLRPDLLEDVGARVGLDLTLRRRPGYGHGCPFVSTFMADHLSWAAERLR